LHGRIDRIDRHPVEGRFAVLDYKTQNKKKLAEKLALPGEDVQLAVYALLLGEEDIADGAYVSLDDKHKVDAVSVGQTLPETAVKVGGRLSELFGGMSRGERLPANPNPRACQYCEMRGLCRLDYWSGES